MIIPTCTGRWSDMDEAWIAAMREWLTANRFNIDLVPIDARIEIRDGTCLGVQLFERDAQGRITRPHPDGPAVRRTEWHPLVEQPPAILLPETGQP